MAWFRIIAKANGERQHVEAKDLAEVRQSYPAKHYFLPRALDCEPGECDRLVGGKLVECAETRAALDREARYEKMTWSQFADALKAELKAEIKGAEPPQNSTKE